MLRQVAVALVVAVGAVSAVNALSVNTYRDEKNDEMRTINKSYLAGVRDGIIAVNRAIVLEGKKPYFCPPDELRFEQAEDILLQEGKKSRSLEHMPVWAVLFEALKETFPCKETNK